MTREELWKQWFLRMDKGEAEAELKEQFFKDIASYLSAEITRIASDTMGDMYD